MQTVYILKNCIKCYKALVSLYKNPDMSTVITIVGKKQSKILLLDKRVKEFPFIVNTLPTTTGLIPKKAKVLPLRIFLQLKNKPTSGKKINRINRINRIKQKCNKTQIQKVQNNDGSVEIILN